MSEAAAWIARLDGTDPAIRIQAAQVLGDWLYPRDGLAEAEVRRIHQALLDAAAVELDPDAATAELGALLRSERPRLGLTGWRRLARAAPGLPPEPRDLALALLSVTGDPGLADLLERLATERPDFDTVLVHKTVAEIRRTTRPE